MYIAAIPKVGGRRFIERGAKRSVGIHVEDGKLSPEFFLHDADNRCRLAAHARLFADHLRITAESSLPEGIAEDEDGGFARVLAFAWKDEPAESGPHTKRGKIVAADAADGKRVAMAFSGEVQAPSRGRAEDFADRRSLFPEFHELRIGKAERSERGITRLNHQSGDLFGGGHRQTLQQEAIY